MSGEEQLVALGFARYWVRQALELTNYNTNYAMEWLLSDEFKLAKQAYEAFQKKKSQNNPEPKPKPKPGLLKSKPIRKHSSNKNANGNAQRKRAPSQPNENEFLLEYNLNQPDLKPHSSILDLNIAGILDDIGTDSDSASVQQNNNLEDDTVLNHFLQPSLVNPVSSNKKTQAKKTSDDISKEPWLCPACGKKVDGALNRCGVCDTAHALDTDWLCHICTFVNDEESLVCEMCLSNKLNLSLNANNSEQVSLKSEETWSCPACEYHNTQTKACHMCGYVQGAVVTQGADDMKQPAQVEAGSIPKRNDLKINANAKEAVVLTTSNKTENQKNHLNQKAPKQGPATPVTPSKHVSANSQPNTFISLDDLPEAPKHNVKVKSKAKKKKKKPKVKPGSGGQVMLQRKKKVKKKQAEEEDEESSSLSEVVGELARSLSSEKQKRSSIIGAFADMAVKGDDEEADLPFKDFDIPIMDANTDLAFDSAMNNNKHVRNNNAPQQKSQQPQQQPQQQQQSKPPQKTEKKDPLSGFALLKAMYPANSQKQKIKLKLKVGTVVDIYSASKQDWIEGIIKEIKGDLICIVYGRKMKWLKKNSRQLRPKQAMVSQALRQQSMQPKEIADPQPQKQLQPQPQQQYQPPPQYQAPPQYQSQYPPLQQQQQQQPAPIQAQQQHQQHQQIPSVLALASAPLQQDNVPAAFAINAQSNIPLAQAQQQMFDEAVKESLNEFQPPPPSGPPPAFVQDFVQYDQQQIENNINSNNLQQQNQQNQQFDARPDEFDYDVTFTTSVLGLELYPDKDGKNCIVGKCLSKTAKKFVDPGSIIVRVNDMFVGGMSYDMVRDAIKQGAKYPPLNVMFRIKINNIGKKKKKSFGNERGYLKVKVVAGVQLKHRASYCVVQVGQARLSTREVPRDEHPEWQEMLTFKNFRPDASKKALISVYDHSKLLKDKKIGSVEFALPTEFNKLQRDTLELKNSKGKLSGVVILNTIIIHKTNSIKHLRKY